MFSKIRERLTTTPFTPFVIRTSDGHDYEIRHPEMALVSRGYVAIGVGGDPDGVPDDLALVSLLHVTAVLPMSAGQLGETAG